MSKMKYMLLLTQGEWQESASEEERKRVFGELMKWFTEHRAAGHIAESAQLQPPGTATTVVIERGRSVLLDRPLLEAKEAIGGYAVLEMANLDEAIAVARSFPVPDGKVEVRPVVER
jgi:hypothetical protein